VFVGRHDDLGYNQAAWEGSESLARAFPDDLVLRVEDIPETERAAQAMEDLIDRGAHIIFATSYGYLPFAVEVARRHPDVIVLHQGGIAPRPIPPNFGTYWGTVYEQVYLAGITAGAATRTHRLGYVVAFPIPAMFNNVNAFMLGAQTVDPRATTIVRFTGSWCAPARQREETAALLAEHVDVLAQHQDCTRTILEMAERAHVAAVGYHSDGSEVAPNAWLTGAVWDWRAVFGGIVRTILEGKFVGSRYNADYIGGLRTGDNPFVLTEFGPRVDAETRKRIASAEILFRRGGSPFDAAMVDQAGVVRSPKGSHPTYDSTLRMNYFVRGVLGSVPK